jgi:hypothetical protein
VPTNRTQWARGLCTALREAKQMGADVTRGDVEVSVFSTGGSVIGSTTCMRGESTFRWLGVEVLDGKGV